jgi:hypothetical protein
MLSRPYAFGCVLRLRTSTEFKPGNSVSVCCMGWICNSQFLHLLIIYRITYYCIAVWSLLSRSRV